MFLQKPEYLFMRPYGVKGLLTWLLAGALSVSFGTSLALAQGKDYRTVDQSYVIPDVELTDAKGRSVNLPELINDEENTIVSFIFTSCPGICPMITSNMVRAQPALDEIHPDYKIILVSLDPQYDTPERLDAYSKRFKTGDKVHFLTGAREDVFKVLQGFDAMYEGSNKMNHQPTTLIRRPDIAEWRRVEGLIGSETLIDQYELFVRRDADSTASRH